MRLCLVHTHVSPLHLQAKDHMAVARQLSPKDNSGYAVEYSFGRAADELLIAAAGLRKETEEDKHDSKHSACKRVYIEIQSIKESGFLGAAEWSISQNQHCPFISSIVDLLSESTLIYIHFA